MRRKSMEPYLFNSIVIVEGFTKKIQEYEFCHVPHAATFESIVHGLKLSAEIW